MRVNLLKEGKRKCYVCKNILPLTNNFFHIDKCRSGGLRNCCKKCLNEKMKFISRKKSLTPEGIYNNYKKSAPKRNIEFNISFEKFEKVRNKKCYYCNSENSNGVDRVDNKKGYIVDNLVACCKICNFMKRDLDKEEFIERCKRISDNFNK